MEGSTTLGMNSDIDLVYLWPFYYAIEKSNIEKTPALFNLMIDKSAPNGYCKLCKHDGHLELELEPYFYYHKGECFIPSSHIEKHFPFTTDMSGLIPMVKNGPSSSARSTDHIKAILVPSHLSMTSKIINRFRSYLWPSRQVIARVKNENGLVVPIGHPRSEDSNVEWRISYSFAERLLIFNFNITQLRTLVLLKMMRKTFFHPVVGDEFTSYHCKTILFFTLARTLPCLWREDRLFHCILVCLSTLQQFLSNQYYPSFFDQSVNLFTGKMTPLFCKLLKKTVDELLIGNLTCLLQIRVDDIGSRILNFQSIIDSSFSLSRRYNEKQIIAEIISDRNLYLIEYSRFPYVVMFDAKLSLKKQIHTGFKLVKELLNFIAKGDEIQQVVAKLMLPHYIVKHSSLLAAYRIKKKQPISKEIVDMFTIGFPTDATSSKLKLASVFCCNSAYEKSLQVLNQIRDIFTSSNVLIPTCFMHISTFSPFWKKCYEISEETVEDVYSTDAYSSCVEFNRKDIWCCPIGLRRSVLNFIVGKLPDLHDAESFHNKYGIELDSNVVFHYLCYLTYSGLSRDQKKIEAIKNLMQIVFGSPKAWSMCFFEIADMSDLEIVCLCNKWVDNNGICDGNDLRINTLLNNLRKESFGSIRECLYYTFGRNSNVQHPALALILIGYSFERENKLDLASSFYWISFILEPSVAADQHLLRVCPSERDIFEYFIDFHNDVDDMVTSIRIEIKLLPLLVQAFNNIMKTFIYLGLLQEANFQEGVYKARCYICLLNALVKNMDRQESKPLEIFPDNQRIVQAKRNSILL